MILFTNKKTSFGLTKDISWKLKITRLKEEFGMASILPGIFGFHFLCFWFLTELPIKGK